MGQDRRADRCGVGRPGGGRAAEPSLAPGALLCLALLAGCAELGAQSTGTGVSEPSAQASTTELGTGPVDPIELEAFLDGMMVAHLREKGIAGATVSVVRAGELLLAKGYGFANVADRLRVDPERTLFRIGSVTKLFTWTAVMQLVEDGLLDLGVDVNEYLEFSIPATYPEPITLTHLLQHTPGFEEDSRGLFTRDVDGIVPMGRWLAENVPARVRPPGEFSAYSNYGTALAGHIVANVSGLSWDEFIEARILEPLGMEWASGRQPLPGHLEPYMSEGYSRKLGAWEDESWEIITGAAPAGSMSVSAADMARFMIAHLNEGVLDGERILGAETARRMHARLFTHDDRLPGFGLGFYEKSSHGVRIIGHGGNTQWFHTDMALMPELGLGVFVSYNTSTGADLSFEGFLPAFLDHYFPPEPAPRSTLSAEEFAGRAAGITGTYRFNRSSHTTFQKAFDLAGAVRFEALDGALVFRGLGEEKRLVEVGPHLYREEFGEIHAAFRVDASGRATHAFLSPAPMMALERVAWHGLPGLHFSILGAGILFFLSVVVAAGARGYRRLRGRPGAPEAGSVRLGRNAILASGLAHLTFVVAIAALASDFWGLLMGPLTGLYLALALPVLGLVATGVATGALVQSFRSSGVGRWTRVRLAGAVAVALLFSWSLHYWNLLGWRI